ncbi:MAG: alpha/beta fold hydrolase [Limnohabitans sp.]
MGWQWAAGMAVETDGEGPAVVCVHGLGGSHNTWTAMRQAFEGHRLVCLDLPGCGHSEGPVPGDWPQLVEALAGVCRALNLSKAHWVGHSMGSLLVLHLAQQHPEWVERMVLLGPVHAPTEPMRHALLTRAERLGQAPAALAMQTLADQTLVAGISAHSRHIQPLAWALLRQDLVRQSPAVYAAYCRLLARAPAADLAPLTMPSLLITGDEDAVAPAHSVRALAGQLRRARTEILPRCGHWAPLERPHDCVRATRGFLRQRV